MSGIGPSEGKGDECDSGDWRKASYSMSNGHCLEAARLSSGSIGIRDTKAAGVTLRFEPQAWTAFLAGLRR